MSMLGKCSQLLRWPHQSTALMMYSRMCLVSEVPAEVMVNKTSQHLVPTYSQHWSKNSTNAQELQRIVAHPESDRNELPQEIYNRHKCFHKYGLNRFRTHLNKMKEMCNKKSNNRAANKLGRALGKLCDLCLLLFTCSLTT